MIAQTTYPFALPPLPYAYDALEPYVDEATMHFHHDKHYQTYVDKLNAILADYPQLQQMTLTELLTSEDNKLASLQEEARESIHNNGGGVYNHQLYFDSMRSPVGQEPCGTLEEALIRDFGSVRQWKEQMSQFLELTVIAKIQSCKKIVSTIQIHQFRIAC